MFGFGSQFSTDKKIIKKAFYSVMSSINVDENIKAMFFEQYVKANKNGSPKKEKQAAIDTIGIHDFYWPEFNKWDDDFSYTGYPYMWGRIEKIRDELCNTPLTIKDSLYLFTVSEIKLFLKELGVNPKPAPKKKEDFERLMLDYVDYHSISSIVQKKHKDITDKLKRKLLNEKCEILVHYISFISYQIRDNDKRNSYKFLYADASCPIEKKFADEFNKENRKDLPPYFPGDRTHIISFKNKTAAVKKGIIGGQQF